MIHKLTIILCCLYLCTAQAQTKVEPNWKSLQERGYPQWFNRQCNPLAKHSEAISRAIASSPTAMTSLK